MSPIALTREQCRELDRRAIEEYGISSLVLMENAGRGCVDVLERLGIDGPVVIFCGKGNNAGDGFVIARHLTIRGYECRVLLLAAGSGGELRGDAAANYALLRGKWRLPISLSLTICLSSLSLFPGQLDFHAHGCTGSSTRCSAPVQKAIRDRHTTLRSTGSMRGPKSTRVLAVDVPSGLDCNTGQPAKHTVRADHTCTFAAMKIGFPQPAAKPFTGTVHVCDIGVPPSLIQRSSTVDLVARTP